MTDKLFETTSHLVMPKDLNSYGTLFGGTLISWMDELAVILGIKITGRECVTTHLANIELVKSVAVHDILDMKAEIVKIGRCSLIMKVNVYRDKKDSVNEYIASGNIKFVVLDENKKPTMIK